MQGDQVLLRRDPEPLVDWRRMPFHSPYSRLRPLVVTHRGASGIPGSFRVLRGSKSCHQEQVLQRHAYGESWVLLQRTPRQQPLRPLTRFRPLKRARSDTTGAKKRSSRALGRTRSDPGRRRVQAPPVPAPSRGPSASRAPTGLNSRSPGTHWRCSSPSGRYLSKCDTTDTMTLAWVTASAWIGHYVLTGT